MIGIFKIFNPKYWRAAKVLGKGSRLFSRVRRGSAAAWKATRTFIARNKNWMAAVTAGITVAFIREAVTRYFENEEELNASIRSKGGDPADPKAYYDMRRNECLDKAISALRALKYDEKESIITDAITNYNRALTFISDDDKKDFAITTNKSVAGLFDCGLDLEDEWTSSIVLSNLRQDKDAENTVDSIAASIKCVLGYDAHGLPMKGLV
jgi:hypothetical protein